LKPQSSSEGSQCAVSSGESAIPGDIKQPPALPGATPAPHALPPRAALQAHLIEALQAALAEGDGELARICHETLGRLLVAPPPPAAVVDLAAARARRER
jgi:hypothetical protein